MDALIAHIKSFRELLAHLASMHFDVSIPALSSLLSTMANHRPQGVSLNVSSADKKLSVINDERIQSLYSSQNANRYISWLAAVPLKHNLYT